MCKGATTTTAAPSSTFSTAGTTKRRASTPPELEGVDVKSLSLQARANMIRNVITKEEKRLRGKYRILSHEWQNTVGGIVLLGSAAVMAIATYYWCQSQLSTWGLILINSLAMSFVHEMEHDLIHTLYWKDSPVTFNLAFFLIWMLKISVDPWWRQKQHLHHHEYSGTKYDVEERLIGLGLPLGLKRFLITLSPSFAPLAFSEIKKDNPQFEPVKVTLLNTLVVISAPLTALTTAFVASGAADALLPVKAALFFHQIFPYVQTHTFGLVIPNIIRHSTNTIVATYTHYYGDLPNSDVYYQTQILDHPILYPFQAFCFNFGQTHIIHHYIARQPFYLRQVIAFKALPVMIELGCRYNDLGAMFRHNRFYSYNNIKIKDQEDKVLHAQ